MALGPDIFARPWVFVRSVPSLKVLPPEGPAEIAFAGRSNVGKSTLINALLGQKGLARTSNTPGRTQALNYFVPDNPDEEIIPELALVDMPGYGYAKAPKSLVDQWTKLIFDYLSGRVTLARVFVLIDARHGIKPIDTQMFDLLDKSAVSYQIVLTKLDKLTTKAVEPRLVEVAKVVAARPAAFPEVLGTSSHKADGLDELKAAIAFAVTG